MHDLRKGCIKKQFIDESRNASNAHESFKHEGYTSGFENRVGKIELFRTRARNGGALCASYGI